jgi:hypothetical protein
MTDEFTLPLAVLDFVPVLLTGIGFIYIIRLVSLILPSQGRIAFLGGLMVVAGGFLRALWKLLIVLSGGDLVIDWMGSSLFVLMAPGYVLLAWSIWQFSRSMRRKRTYNAWLPPLLLALILWAASYFLARTQPESLAWKSILISVTVLANLVSGILLITFAFRQGLSKAGWLFIVNLIVVFILNGLARAAEQTVMIHWMAESVDSVSTLCYAIAVWIVCQHVYENVGNHPSVVRPLTKAAN